MKARTADPALVWGDVRCVRCGQYTGEPADRMTPWGGHTEPLPEEYLCQRCADWLFRRLLDDLLAGGLPTDRGRPYWQSPHAWTLAKATARGLWNHGLRKRPERHQQVGHDHREGIQVEICGNCGRPRGHPTHDRADALRHGIPVCGRFQRSVSRWVTPVKVRVRCSCGWASPWQVASIGYADETFNAHLQALAATP